VPTPDASGFQLKQSAVEELPQAIRTAAAGEAFLSSNTTRQALNRLPTPSAAPQADLDRIATLSQRKQKTLVLLSQGLSNAVTAGQLFVTEGTVKTHVPGLREAGLRQPVKDAMLAQRAGLLDELPR
jgi:DNA-binding NarL/FixJ family response regulator